MLFRLCHPTFYRGRGAVADIAHLRNGHAFYPMEKPRGAQAQGQLFNQMMNFVDFFMTGVCRRILFQEEFLGEISSKDFLSKMLLGIANGNFNHPSLDLLRGVELLDSPRDRDEGFLNDVIDIIITAHEPVDNSRDISGVFSVEHAEGPLVTSLDSFYQGRIVGVPGNL